jgi:hypothetical protein
MKVLFLDFLYPKGHTKQNVSYINNLAKISDVYVYTPSRRYTGIIKEVKIIEDDHLQLKHGKLSNRLSVLKIMIKSSILASKIKPDVIFIASYDTMVFAIGRFLFRNDNNIFLLQHFNVDELQNKIKLMFFNSYKNKYKHVVFEGFIKNFLEQEIKVKSNNIFILPHQLNENSNSLSKPYKYTCVGLSFSNDENLIKEIIDVERERALFKNAKCKVVLKSQKYEFDNGYLKVIKGFIHELLYDQLINESKSIYMPFPSTFNYRMSGTLIDAFSNNKIVIASNIKLIQYFSTKYKNICRIAGSVGDFFEMVIELEKEDLTELELEFERFKKNHSNENILKALKEIIYRG